MRVLYAGPFPPRRDGIGDYTARLAGRVGDAGHEVRVVVPARAAGAPPEVVGALDGSSGGVAGLMERVDAFDPDVVHVQFAVAAFGARTPALLRLLGRVRRRRAAVVVTAHEVTRDIARLRAPGRALYRRLAGLADRVLVHTEAARAELTRSAGVAPEAVQVVPHPRVEPPPASSTPAALRARHGLGDDRVLLAFGFVHVDKGLDDLVEALAQVRASDPGRSADVRLVIAGSVRAREGAFRVFEARDRRYERRVMRAAQRGGVGDRVVLTGYVPDGEVAPWFAAAEAVVLPYRRIEQSSVASLAAALGVPVIASTAGGLAEEFGDPCHVLPPGDPAGIAAALAGYLRAERPAASPRGGGWDLARVAATTLDVYEAGRRPAPIGRPHARHA